MAVATTGPEPAPHHCAGGLCSRRWSGRQQQCFPSPCRFCRQDILREAQDGLCGLIGRASCGADDAPAVERGPPTGRTSHALRAPVRWCVWAGLFDVFSCGSYLILGLILGHPLLLSHTHLLCDMPHSHAGQHRRRAWRYCSPLANCCKCPGECRQQWIGMGLENVCILKLREGWEAIACSYQLRIHTLANHPQQAASQKWDRTAQLWVSAVIWVMTGGDATSLDDLERNRVGDVGTSSRCGAAGAESRCAWGRSCP